MNPRPQNLKIDSWFSNLQHLFVDIGMTKIKNELKQIYPNVCPDISDIWNAFNHFKFSDTRVVFVFLSPYNNTIKGKRLATGLATAVPDKSMISPTLHVMLDSLADYTGNHLIEHNFDTTLESWAKQGILLLNTALTVPLNGDPKSHVKMWDFFVGGVLLELSYSLSGLIFVLCGNQAKDLGKKNIQHKNKHHIIECCHPAATHYQLLSHKFDYNDIEPKYNFMQYKVFEQIDNILFKQTKEKIKWTN